jgi:hypothetical protein
MGSILLFLRANDVLVSRDIRPKGSLIGFGLFRALAVAVEADLSFELASEA